MQNFTVIIGVIELRQDGIGFRDIQSRFKIGSSTANLILERFSNMGMTLEQLKAMEPKEVEAKFYPAENRRSNEKPMPDFERYHKKMLEMKHPDLAYIWLHDYKKEHSDGYQLTQFYKLYGDYLKENFGQTKVKMAVERIPGERMYIDWVGDQPALLLQPSTGEVKPVHILATTLGFGSCVYSEAFLNEKIQSFITGVVHALEYYGAVPKYLVPDNLRTAVTKHTNDELVLNSLFSDLEDFYDVVTLPPPSRKPRGKATVENHVKYLEVHLVEPLKEKVFTSLEALNEEIRKITDEINTRSFGRKQDIRKNRLQAFETYDKPQMRLLPGGNFNICDYRFYSKVPENYHLEYDGHYYSVPHERHGEPAILKATISEIRVCDQNNKLICRHLRSYKEFPRYITDETHMPAEHLYSKELNAHDGAYYRRWASTFGKSMETLIDRVLRSAKHEEQVYNSCKGILHMSKDVPYHIVEEAAQMCLDARACKYSYYKKALSRLVNHDSAPAGSGEHLPIHGNIRGRDSYQ